MERIQIKKRKDAKGDLIHTGNYDYYIDGEKQDMKWVKSVNVRLDAYEKPEVTIVAHPKYLELDIDGEVETIIDSYFGARDDDLIKAPDSNVGGVVNGVKFSKIHEKETILPEKK